MARRFIAGNLDFGSDASIDDYTQRTLLMWLKAEDPEVGNTIFTTTKSDAAATPTGWLVTTEDDVTSSHWRLQQNFSLTNGIWDAPNGSAGTVLRHLGVVYDRGATGNDPTIYVDGASQAITELTMPVGDTQGDAVEFLRATAFGLGRMGFIVYDSTMFTSASVNRHRWWGVAPGGPSTVDVWHPFWTDNLVNKGTATASPAAAQTEMNNADVPRVERCWASTLGVGR